MSKIESENFKYRKIINNINLKGKININHIILNRNNPISKFNSQTNQKNILKKERISPFKYNNLSSLTLLNKAYDSLQNQKKLFIKSPFSLLKCALPSANKIHTNKNKSSSLPGSENKKIGNKVLNHLRNIEYNSINYIINNFNLSCKNFDTPEDNNKKSDSLIKFNNCDYLEKRNRKIRNKMHNLKKNNSMSNYANSLKNLSQLVDINNSNGNNITNDDIKTEEINLENKQLQERIKKRHQENKKKMIYLKELEKKNQRLKNDYQEVKIKNIEYNKSLERLFRFLRVLRNNGMDIDEMMDNISSGEDYDEYVDLDEENEESEEFEEDEKNEVVLSDGSVISNLKQLSSGLLRNHDEFTKGSKLNLKTNIIPMLNIWKIKNH